MSEHVFKVIHRDGPDGDDTRLVARCGDLATAQRLCDVHNGRPLRWEQVSEDQWQAGRIVDQAFGLRYYAVLQERIYGDVEQERDALIQDATRPMDASEG